MLPSARSGVLADIDLHLVFYPHMEWRCDLPCSTRAQPGASSCELALILVSCRSSRALGALYLRKSNKCFEPINPSIAAELESAPTTDVFTRIYTYSSWSNARCVNAPNLALYWPLYLEPCYVQCQSRRFIPALAPNDPSGAIEILTSTLCFPLHSPLRPESAHVSPSLLSQTRDQVAPAPLKTI